MAVTKKRKQEILAEYKSWIAESKAMVFTEYKGMNMKGLDALRATLREAGCEFHIVKNTIGRLAMQESGIKVQEDLFEGSTAVGFGFQDAPGLAKTMVEYAEKSEFVNIKGGYLGTNPITASDVKALADLPPLPVMRAQLLGTLLAPASQLVRVLAEPGRQIAAVIKAHSEAESSASA